MSIINDALKKAEKYIQKELSLHPVATGRPKSKNKVALLLAYVLIICLGIFLSNLTLGYFSHKQAPTLKVAQTIKPAPVPVVAANPVPENKPQNTPVAVAPELKKEASEDNFVLNGIFFSGDESYALINNEIVRINESVGKATVKTITKDMVELEKEGRIITLSTRNR